MLSAHQEHDRTLRSMTADRNRQRGGGADGPERPLTVRGAFLFQTWALLRILPLIRTSNCATPRFPLAIPELHTHRGFHIVELHTHRGVHIVFLTKHVRSNYRPSWAVPIGSKLFPGGPQDNYIHEQYMSRYALYENTVICAYVVNNCEAGRGLGESERGDTFTFGDRVPVQGGVSTRATASAGLDCSASAESDLI
jgi:hypothetical protein